MQKDLPLKEALNYNVKGIIYGEHGIGKTTLALSAKKPLLIDFDDGLKRVTGFAQKDVSVLEYNSYNDLLQKLSSNEIDKFSCIIIDTVSKCMDFVFMHCTKDNKTLLNKNGDPTIRGWNVINNSFKAILRILESKDVNIIFIASEKEVSTGGKEMTVVKRPDCPAGSRKIMQSCDFIGYMSAKDNGRNIDFLPNEFFYAKNCLGFTHSLFIPMIDNKSPHNWIEKNIISARRDIVIREKIEVMEYKTLIKKLSNELSSLKSLDDFNDYIKNKLNKHERVWDSFFKEKEMLFERMKDKKFTFNKDTNLFE